MLWGATSSICTAVAGEAEPAVRPTISKNQNVAAVPQLPPLASPRLTASELGLVINEADEYSIAVGSFYARKRSIPDDRIVRIRLPVKPVLTPDEFAPIRQQLLNAFGKNVQAVALAWRMPWAVGCNSITSALTLGFDAQLCANTCAPSKLSPYFNSRSTRPFTELGIRPSILLASESEAGAFELISRGTAADGSLRPMGRPNVVALYAVTGDKARNVRAPLNPKPQTVSRHGVEIEVTSPVHTSKRRYDPSRLVLYQTGAIRVPHLSDLRFADGALADHLTSSGGALAIQEGGQMSALEWIKAGATGSYGTVSEPCNHPQKFPHPRVVLQEYLNGSTLLEAYWKSVAWPAQGVFIGEPLAAPFSVGQE